MLHSGCCVRPALGPVDQCPDLQEGLSCCLTWGVVGAQVQMSGIARGALGWLGVGRETGGGGVWELGLMFGG